MPRLCVVCGGSRGIGRAVSRLLAERGCRVAVVSRNQDAAQATVVSLTGGTVLYLQWCHAPLSWVLLFTFSMSNPAFPKFGVTTACGVA